MKATFLLATSIFLMAMTPPDPFRCVGTEPFWGVSIKGGNVQFSSIDKKEPITNVQTELFSGLSEAAGFYLRGKLGTTPVTLHFLRGPDCSDGMSETKYEGYAAFDVGTSVYSGCCTTAP
jgi:uncharacterized membrane protein